MDLLYLLGADRIVDSKTVSDVALQLAEVCDYLSGRPPSDLAAVIRSLEGSDAPDVCAELSESDEIEDEETEDENDELIEEG